MTLSRICALCDSCRDNGKRGSGLISWMVVVKLLKMGSDWLAQFRGESRTCHGRVSSRSGTVMDVELEYKQDITAEKH